MKTTILDRQTLASYMMLPEQFRDDELRRATFYTRNGYQAVAWSGGRAAVYKATLADGRGVAVRVALLGVDEATRRRYLAYSALADRRPAHFARTDWVDGGLVVEGEDVALLKMEWIDGCSLDEFVESCVVAHDPGRLRQLADEWRGSMAAMRSVCLAHGDLHAQNVLVTGTERSPMFRFVDYDSLWLPELNVAPAEVGHRAFHHPGSQWGEDMDVFGAAAVYLSLRAVVAEPSIWDLHSSDMTLLLDETDLRGDDRGLWRRLAGSPDPFVRELAHDLREWCGQPLETHSGFEQLLSAAEGRTTTNRWLPSGTLGGSVPPELQLWGRPAPSRPNQIWPAPTPVATGLLPPPPGAAPGFVPPPPRTPQGWPPPSAAPGGGAPAAGNRSSRLWLAVVLAVIICLILLAAL